MGIKRKTIFTRSWVLLLVIIMIATFTSGCGSADNSTEKSTVENVTTASSETKAEVETTKEDSKVNYENFLNIKMGSSLADVESMLGEGNEQSSSEVGGIKTAVYLWNGSSLSNVNVTFQNDEVMGKAQIGLKGWNSNVTLDMYNQIEEGMSLDEVSSILGEGQLMSQAKILDMETLMYVWLNSDGSDIGCTFTDDKMDMKTQTNLE